MSKISEEVAGHVGVTFAGCAHLPPGPGNGPLRRILLHLHRRGLCCCASLALREQDADWSDPNAVAALRICDPACGTGTLLMAAAERIRDLRNAAGRADLADEEALGLTLVEDVLWGYDSNLTATHMAASTIGMLSPSTQFSSINIHRVRLGVVNEVPRLGSLEFLAGQALRANWPGLVERVEVDTPASQPPAMDLVIMNPCLYPRQPAL